MVIKVGFTVLLVILSTMADRALVLAGQILTLRRRKMKARMQQFAVGIAMRQADDDIELRESRGVSYFLCLAYETYLAVGAMYEEYCDRCQEKIAALEEEREELLAATRAPSVARAPFTGFFN